MSNRPLSRRRTALGYWVPLAVTVTAFTVGIAAWIWSERKETDDDDESDAERPQSSGSDEGDSIARIKRDVPAIELHDAAPDTRSPQETLYTRMTDVVRRTPSPQQLIGDTGRRMAAGVAAAGAKFGRGKTLDFRDHERWQEEVELKAAAALVSQDQQGSQASPALLVVHGEPAISSELQSNIGEGSAQTQLQTRVKDKIRSKKKLVAVVVSSVLPADEHQDEDSSMEILNNVASITSSSSHDFVILIYAPHLGKFPTALAANADEPLEDSIASKNSYYDELESMAVQIVPHPAHIIPFTMSTSHVHLLRHLAPNLAYVQEELAGKESEHALQAKSWVGKMIIVTRDDSTVHAEKKNGFQCTRVSDLAEHFETIQ